MVSNKHIPSVQYLLCCALALSDVSSRISQTRGASTIHTSSEKPNPTSSEKPNLASSEKLKPS